MLKLVTSVKCKTFVACATSVVLLFGAFPETNVTVPPLTVRADNGQDWLTTKGNKIVDSNGNEVWLTGVNWFGFNTQRRTFDGIWTSSLYDNLDLIADHGMNILRVPIASELILNWAGGKAAPLTWEFSQTYNGKELGDLGIEIDWASPKHPTDLQVFDLALKYCKKIGLKVMLDIHSNEISDNGHQHEVWYTTRFDTASYFSSLEWITERYKNDDTIIAIDLKNEPHGKKSDARFAKWDNSTDINNWKYAAETAAKKVLDINPNLLILVEGIEVYPKEGQNWDSPAGGYGIPENFYGAWWGANLRGVKDYPIDLGKYQDQLVYSPHDYGPSVWEQSWFYDGFNKDTMHADYWYDTWAYIYEDSTAPYTAPLLIGEWGGFVDGDMDERGGASATTKRNTHWLTCLREYIIENKIHHTFWCFNYNSSDTGGLMYNDFKDWNEPKYQFLKPALWQTADGKFIGLSQTVPLGKNGISLSEYSGNPNPPKPPEPTATPANSTTPVVSTPATTPTATPKESETTPFQSNTPIASNTASNSNSPAVSTETQATPTLKGDVDLSGKVDIGDVILLAKFLVGTETLTAQQKANANVENPASPAIDVNDNFKIVQYIANFLPSFD
jgi:hypothetical protein